MPWLMSVPLRRQWTRDMALKLIAAAFPSPPLSPASGAGMDRLLPKRRPNFVLLGGGVLVMLAGLAVIAWLIPHGFQVAESDIRIATAHPGLFRDDVVVRSIAEPLHTIMIDALESGRVEEVVANDGAFVAKGALLFRLSNPQLSLNLVAREADRAQQISNLSNLRVSIETSQTEHQRRLLDLKFALAQAEKQYSRNAALAKTGVIAAVALEESEDRLAKQRQALDDENSRTIIEMRIKRDGIRQMEQAIEQLNVGLKVVNESIEALAVRAPIAGRLTDFRLQLGEIVKAEQRIGRIDDPRQFKLTAQIDEYFLGSVLTGKKGAVTVNGRDYAVVVNRIFPQITEGRFSVELLFTGDAPPDMSPGQSMQTKVTLGDTVPGLLLPNDAYLNDTGGAWVYVLASDGRSAKQRAIHIQRRNDSQVQVASGIVPGERVVVSTYAAFGSAKRLRITQ